MSSSSNNNISISSLLDSGSSSEVQPQQQGTRKSSSSSSGNNRNGTQRAVPISEMVSKYKTSINLTNDDPDIIVISDTPTPRGSRKTSPSVANKPPTLPRTKSKTSNNNTTQSGSKSKKETVTSATATSAFVSDQVKKFQTSFQLNPVNTSPSKTSINSIINIDDSSSQAPTASQTPSPAVESATGGTKRKRNVIYFDAKKRRSGSPAASNSPKQPLPVGNNNNTQTISPVPILAKASTPSAQPVKIQPSTKSSTTSSKSTSKSTKPQTQQLQKSPVIDKKSNSSGTTGNGTQTSSATTTTSKSDPVIPVKVAAPTVIDLLNIDDEEEVVSKEEKPESTTTVEKSSDKPKDKEKEKEKEKQQEAPIIALDIPLLDSKNPQPGKAEVIVNVLKLAEEKYGWSVMHPNSKNALDMMDDMIDDEDDDDNDEDEDIIEVPNPSEQQQQQQANSTSGGKESNSGATTQKGKELTEEQLFRQHEVKMIRKVGKYDFEDPFIDDEELQIEEDISSTKEGFFVYWGPLVDEKTVTKIKKKR
ncbi:predicted protein [Candida tropicalis MYA-3404]|uniref:Hpc2-related domain-containing protein n=1 Tax=Candida tropicalis (strain ATCC MYA-3404 / T1) TaxID=294747 RepID=C5MC73_CANTT|nr:predicted protein [Candida tropicalis MYA-3404]EER33240.1 predicted protein [Candida tropicalis MYA-3404]KAG4407071.1 hypothetical protein JTP64_004455 [Candida tropicalis]